MQYTLRRGVAEWGKWGHTFWAQAVRAHQHNLQ